MPVLWLKTARIIFHRWTVYNSSSPRIGHSFNFLHAPRKNRGRQQKVTKKGAPNPHLTGRAGIYIAIRGCSYVERQCTVNHFYDIGQQCPVARISFTLQIVG
jgi:hypothetical protein